MIQKKTVTSGTLLSICRNLSERAGLAVIEFMGAGSSLRPDRLLKARPASMTRGSGAWILRS
jgi:hypothetical protein